LRAATSAASSSSAKSGFLAMARPRPPTSRTSEHSGGVARCQRSRPGREVEKDRPDGLRTRQAPMTGKPKNREGWWRQSVVGVAGEGSRRAAGRCRPPAVVHARGSGSVARPGPGHVAEAAALLPCIRQAPGFNWSSLLAGTTAGRPQQPAHPPQARRLTRASRLPYRPSRFSSRQWAPDVSGAHWGGPVAPAS
jgi:hypothetical protein